MLDLIGYSTASDDALVAQGIVHQILVWEMSLPLWVPWGFALITTMWLMWVSWPRATISSRPEQDLRKLAPTDQYEIIDNTSVEPAASSLEANDDASFDESKNVVNNMPFDQGLYVGIITISNDKLDSDSVINITFRCFNGTNSDFLIRNTSGQMKLDIHKSREEIYDDILPLPAMTAVNDGIGKIWDESRVAFEQRIPKEISSDFASFSRTHNVWLNLEGLSIWISPDNDMSKRYRVPVPSVISLSINDERFHVGRVINLSGNY